MKLLSIITCTLLAAMLAAADFSLGLDAPQTDQTVSRERQCLNGLWRFLPLADNESLTDTAPAAGNGWGYFKVPGIWPQNDSDTSAFTPMLPKERLKNVENWHTAWYRRTVTVPAAAAGKEVILEVEHIQTRVRVYLDQVYAGEIVYPGGTVNLTKLVRPGTAQTLELRVSAVPLSEDHFVVMDGNNVRKVAAKIKTKGITGDVYLHIVPASRIDGFAVVTKLTDQTVSFDADLTNLKPDRQYTLSAQIFDRDGKLVKEFTGQPFTAKDAAGGKVKITDRWSNPELWDVESPQNLYTAQLSLRQGDQLVDQTLPERFGFREFRIDGKNYVLNGKVIHLRAYHLPNFSAFWMPDKASKEAAKEAYRRLTELGFNFAISRNYNFAEGEVGYLRDSFDAADETGYLLSVSLPHPWQFGGDLAKPGKADEYAAMSKYLIQKYRNHPAIILWVTNHNHAGAWGDQNPLRLGGDYQRANDAKEVAMKEVGRNNFLIAQQRILELDPTRPVYSHASGSLGGQYSLNTYLDWAPMQERSDWLEEFSKTGKYPLSFVEWGLPHIASFSSYRWPQFIWNADDVMTVWDAEYIAAYRGDEAARWTGEREVLLDKLVKLGNNKTRWGALSSIAGKLPGVIQTQADFYRDNLPAMRAWGIGLLLPWDDYAFFRANPGKFPAVENPNRWQNLNRPGLVPDFYNYGDYILSASRDQYSLSPLGEVIKIWNQPLIAWIGGEKVFTTKEHIYRPGDTVAKQLVILNDTRQQVGCDYEFWLRKVNAPAVRGKVVIAPGGKAVIPVKTELPQSLPPGNYELAANFRFDGDRRANDSFAIDVIAPDAPVKAADIMLYDPKGLTAQLLNELKIPFHKVDSDRDFAKAKLLIIGREALSADGPGLNLDAVRDGLNVLIFEQSTAAIERLGFRYNEMGLRQVFPRAPGHPALRGLPAALLSDWRGEATLLPPYIDYNQFFCPEWQWCGFKNTRVWRCRNRGTVSAVLIEKPSVGNFTPLADGGFALQYAPLLEYQEGKGRIVFCQMEVTARTEQEPAAARLVRNLIDYLASAPSAPAKNAAVIGNSEFQNLLQSLRLQNLTADPAGAQVIIAGPGAARYPDVSNLVNAGATLIAAGLTAAELNALLPGTPAKDLKAQTSQMSDLSAVELTGISNLDTYFQTRLDYAAVDGRELSVRQSGKGKAVILGVAPSMLDYDQLFRLRSSYRRRVFLLSQILRNADVASDSVLLERFKSAPVAEPWLKSYYLQTPIAGDDPYRYYHW